MKIQPASHAARSAPRLMPFLVIVFAVLLAACGAGAGVLDEGKSLPDAGSVGAPVPGTVNGEGGDRDGGSTDVPPGGLADLAQRAIVKTGEITVEVPKVATAVGAVRAMVLQLGGYVGGTSAGGPDESATLTLRIPADRFDEALAQLHDLDGTVKAEGTREEDVTSSIVDLEARIANLEASERQYRALLDRAEKIDDILSIQSRLDDVRGQIEQLKAQHEQLSGLADLATLTVSLVPASSSVEAASEGWDPGKTLDQALGALVSFGQAIGTGLIWLGIVGLPVALLALIAFALVRRLAPAGTRRAKPEAAGE